MIVKKVKTTDGKIIERLRPENEEDVRILREMEDLDDRESFGDGYGRDRKRGLVRSEEDKNKPRTSNTGERKKHHDCLDRLLTSR